MEYIVKGNVVQIPDDYLALTEKTNYKFHVIVRQLMLNFV